MKTQTFGIEMELTGITRTEAAKTIAAYFGTQCTYTGGAYYTHEATDRQGRRWQAMRDSSIRAQKKSFDGQKVSAGDDYKTEVVSPILHYEDIEDVQELVRQLRKKGAFANSSCGIHIHIGAERFTPQTLRNIVNLIASKEDMCTHLKGNSSFFLPFNKGDDYSKGNPHNENGVNVSYMWEDILKKDTVLYLIDKFIFLQKTTRKNSNTGKRETKENLIFPRYHQFNAVRKLVNDITEYKSEKNYLIEHSAGSGKTNTIAWLAHRLSSLHDCENNNIFDSIVIMTDRIIVDRQLQDAVLSMKHKAGLIKVLDEDCTSKDLADTLNGNIKIIVTTIHKFMYIKDIVKELKAKTFAVIIDEAHSSTAGTAMEAVTSVLSTTDDKEEQSMADKIEEEIQSSGKQPNVSIIAFTATPKPTTLQLFGTLNEEGKKVAFDLYSMKQAIDEGFILDVLQNYVTYKTYFEINKAIEDDPKLETIVAKRKIAKYIELHDTNIGQKVEIIMEHFKNNIMHELGDKAKAMVVTSSRQAAVKYKLEFEQYLKKPGYDNIQALIAFSGKVKLDNNEYTEVGMNNIAEKNWQKSLIPMIIKSC